MKSVFLVGLALVSLPSPASAVTAFELLNGYNVIVFGDATSTSDVDGKAFVGGNLNGGTYNAHNVGAGPGLPSLTVGKNLSGNVSVNGPGVAIGGNLATSNYNGNGGGNAYIGGNWTGSANFNLNGTGNVFLGGTKSGSGNINGGALSQHQSSPAFAANEPTAATVSSVQSTLAAYSSALATLGANSAAAKSGGTATFNAAPNAQGLAVFTITDATTFFSGLNQIAFNLNGATELIVNVSGAGASNLNISANFLNGVAPALGDKAIWNFTDAQNLTIGNQFGGDILAVYAAVTLNNNEEGTLVAASLIQHGEIHYDGANPYLPTIPDRSDANPPAQTPLPAAWPMFATGLGLVGWMARRRKRQAARR